MMGMCRGKKMQPIWEFFYKNVIGNLVLLERCRLNERLDLPGLDFVEGEFSL